MRNKFFSRIIVVILLCAFLTMSVGRVTRVSAVGTAIAVSSAAFVATGLTFLAFLALTGAEVSYPQVDTSVWLEQVGEKVAQYPSGKEIYEYAYEHMIANPLTQPFEDALDFVMPLTRNLLRRLTNDFSDTRIIQGIVTYIEYLDVSQTPTNGFTYPYSFSAVNQQIWAGGSTLLSFAEYQQRFNCVIYIYPGQYVDLTISDPDHGIVHTIAPSDVLEPVRNLRNADNTYTAQKFVDGNWVPVGAVTHVTGEVHYFDPVSTRYLVPDRLDYYSFGTVYINTTATEAPTFPQAVIHDAVTDLDLPMTDVSSENEVVSPEWPDVLDPDQEVEYPIIPYTQMPLDVYGGGGVPDPKWGFNLEDLLDILGDLGHAIFDLTVLKNLLNQVGGQSSGDSYIYYDYSDNGVTYNNFEYLVTNNYGDQYITYDIDVSEADEHLPVDLNTIQLYTDNRYIDSFKRSAIAGGSIIRDLVVFWYDVDPEIIYVIFGTCIITLIAAFMGKWGHS